MLQNTADLAWVVQRLDNTIQQITGFSLLTLVNWVRIWW